MIRKKYDICDLIYLERRISYLHIHNHKIKCLFLKRKYNRIKKKLEKDGVII